MRTNVDYGPAILPLGEIVEVKNAPLFKVGRDEDAARFVSIISSPLTFSQENHRVEYQVQELASFKETFNTTELDKYLEQACCTLRQDGKLEIDLKVATQILPETWVNIRKTKEGLHIDFESASDETRSWLQSISMRLSARLKARLHCLVEIAVNDGKNSAHQMDQGNLTKNARHL